MGRCLGWSQGRRDSDTWSPGPAFSCCALRSPSFCITSSSAPLHGSWCRACTSTECRLSLEMWTVAPCASTMPWAGASLLCCWVRSYPLRPVILKLCLSSGLTPDYVSKPCHDPSTSAPMLPTQGKSCLPFPHFLPILGGSELRIHRFGLTSLFKGLAVGLDPEGYGNPDFCWISIHEPLIWSFAGPIVLVIVVSVWHLVLPVCFSLRREAAWSKCEGGPGGGSWHLADSTSGQVTG